MLDQMFRLMAEEFGPDHPSNLDFVRELLEE